MTQDIINYFKKTLNSIRDKLKIDKLRHDFDIEIVNSDKDMGYDVVNNKMVLSKDFIVTCYKKKDSEPLMQQFIESMIIHYHRRQAVYNLYS